MISRKVVSVEGGRPILEATVQTSGKLLGLDCNSTITYQAELRPGGNLSGKLSRLNGLACCFEHEIDDQGNVDDKVWEWK